MRKINGTRTAVKRCGAAAGLLWALSVAAPVSGIAQGAPSGPAAEVQRAYTGLKGNILKAAEAMPAENYGFRPAPETRTFARVLNHITEAQQHSCGALNGTAAAAQPAVPAETADKATIIQVLQASFAACDQAMAAAGSGDLLQMVTASPTAKRSRIGLLWGTASHDNEQYATLALYTSAEGHCPAECREVAEFTADTDLHPKRLEAEMADENSLGPMGPNLLSVEAVSELQYSVQGDNLVTGYTAEVRDAVGQPVQGVAVSRAMATSFTLTLPFATPGPYTLVVRNPDGRSSTLMFATPGTSASNAKLRADS